MLTNRRLPIVKKRPTCSRADGTEDTYERHNPTTVSHTERDEHKRRGSASKRYDKSSAPASPAMMAISAEASAKIIKYRRSRRRKTTCRLARRSAEGADAWLARRQIGREAGS